MVRDVGGSYLRGRRGLYRSGVAAEAIAIGFVTVASIHMLTCSFTLKYAGDMVVSCGGYTADTGVVYGRNSRMVGGGRYARPTYQPVTSFVPLPRVANAVITLALGFVGGWLVRSHIDIGADRKVLKPRTPNRC